VLSLEKYLRSRPAVCRAFSFVQKSFSRGAAELFVTDGYLSGGGSMIA
jgi:hypothetical protein